MCRCIPAAATPNTHTADQQAFLHRSKLGGADVATLQPAWECGSQLTWDDVLTRLGNAEGCAHFNALLAGCPFPDGFFWEAPPLCWRTRGEPFELCVVRAAPAQLDSWSDRQKFAAGRQTFEAVQRGQGNLAPVAMMYGRTLLVVSP